MEENISEEFKLKHVDETRNYLIEEINQNELIRKKPKKVCLYSFESYWVLTYFDFYS